MFAFSLARGRGTHAAGGTRAAEAADASPERQHKRGRVHADGEAASYPGSEQCGQAEMDPTQGAGAAEMEPTQSARHGRAPDTACEPWDIAVTVQPQFAPDSRSFMCMARSSDTLLGLLERAAGAHAEVMRLPSGEQGQDVDHMEVTGVDGCGCGAVLGLGGRLRRCRKRRAAAWETCCLAARVPSRSYWRTPRSWRSARRRQSPRPLTRRWARAVRARARATRPCRSSCSRAWWARG
jgi:hypothetical protein